MVKGVVDTVFVFRFLRMLVLRWNEMEAYKHGIVDDKGKVLRKASTLITSAEKNSYTPFVRLVFNIKRLLEKVPFGSSRLGSFIAALWLIKENAGLNDSTLEMILEKMEVTLSLQESTQWFVVDDTLPKGTYKLQETMVSPVSLESLGRRGDLVEVINSEYVDEIFGVRIYECKHKKSNSTIYVTQWDISR